MQIPTVVHRIFEDIRHTVFPDLCILCDEQPKAEKGSFCVSCHFEMPYTDHFDIKNNDLVRHFVGRVRIHHAAAIVTFYTGGHIQSMMHRLKYKGKKEVGEIFGMIGAKKYLDSKFFERPDLVIPVPIHIDKQKVRGYNQSSIFGSHVAKHLGIPFSDHLIVKIKASQSQTGKSRTGRVENVAEVFEVIENKQIPPSSHILIVDDVVTTGATLEACCLALAKAGYTKISILTIAMAN